MGVDGVHASWSVSRFVVVNDVSEASRERYPPWSSLSCGYKHELNDFYTGSFSDSIT